MTVRIVDDSTIELDGICPVEDAEVLLQYLLRTPRATVDWHTCDRAHSAVIQVLMVCGATLRGPPRGAFLREVVAANFG